MKNFMYFLCGLALISALYSCDKNDDDNGLSFSKSKVEIVIGKTSKVTIKGTDSVYTVISSDSKIATAQVAAKEITVTGVKEGKATLTVTGKSGKVGKIALYIIKDPYLEAKADAKTRFVWNTTSKVQGTDKGTFKLSQASDGKAEFRWESEDAKSTIVLNFSDAVGSVAEGVKTNAKLLIDNKAVTVTSLEVIQSKVVTAGDKATIWIAFSAGSKTGICVGKLQ
jgi:Bacterial Ig-like domain (group 2).